MFFLCVFFLSGFLTSGCRQSRHLEVGISDIRISTGRYLSTGHQQLIDVGTSLAAALDPDEALAAELADVFVHRLPGDAEIGAERVLSGETAILVPGVGEQTRIGELGAGRDLLRSEDRIRDLGEAFVSGTCAPLGFQLDGGAKFQGRSSSRRSLGCPLAIAWSVALR